MLTKKLGFLLMMLLVLVALMQPAPVAACPGGCSGDYCGCGIEGNECRAECGGFLPCAQACTRAQIACSKACCGGF